MRSWSISIDDENYCESVSVLIRDESARFNRPQRSRGKPSQTCKFFFEQVNRVIKGEIEEDELLPVLLKEGAKQVLIKDIYELRVPGFRGFFRINFQTGKGKAILLFREPVDPRQVEMLIQKWQHLE
jgi:hypothetical protein